MHSLERTRSGLAEFLRARREALSPEDVGLPRAARRRTPGLRREEVAALAGVGLTWYTWLEQGRDIGVSASFLDNLARVLKLDALERRHLFLLAQNRPPAEPAKTFCSVPPLAARLVQDITPHAAFVLNLRWDVLAFNAAADHLFGFAAYAPEDRNLLRLVFTDAALRDRLVDWDTQVLSMLASFRRGLATACQDSSSNALLTDLERISPDFRERWRNPNVHAPCTGQRVFLIDERLATYDHTSLAIDGGQHLSLVVYAEAIADR